MTGTRFRARRSPLGRRLVALVSLAIAVTTVGTLGVVARQQMRQARDDLRQQAATLAEMLARSAEFGVYTRNPDALADLLRGLRGYQGIAYVRFLDRSGTVLHQSSPSAGGIPPVTIPRQAMPGRTVRLVERRDPGTEPVLDLVADIRSDDASGLFPDATVSTDTTASGIVQLGWSMAPFDTRHRQLWWRLGLVSLGALGFGLVAAMLLTRRIVAPIQELLDGTEAVKDGRLDHRIAVRRGDELERLGVAFNAMVADLQLTHAAVEEHRRTLEQRVEERTAQLELATNDALRLAEEAQAASRAKSRFLANMSHEIRTPMNGVLGMLELLGRTQLDEVQRHYASIAATSAESLLGVINDVLDFSKVEAGKLTLHPIDFDLASLIEDVCQMLAPRAHGKGLELACAIDGDLPTAVRGDVSRVRQILVNLAGNAVKFTEAGEVVVRATCVASSAREVEVRIEVRDTGIGIASETQATLFNPFIQADGSLTRRLGGTGLGLAIARQLCELMGGQIGLESAPGRGSTFWVVLRFARGAAPPRSGRPGLDGARVLVVDDNASNREILVRQMTSWGVATEAVSSGAAALAELVRDGRYNLVILDLMMPEMDGLELADRIRALPSGAGIRLLLLTSVVEPTEVEVGGVIDAVMTKPIRSVYLRESIAGLLGRSPAPPPSENQPKHDGRLGARVLVAEDNEINQQVVVSFLESLGCSVRLARDGDEAVTLTKRESFDLVLMDGMMPRLDGYGATRVIRELEAAEPGRRRLPIVALTASAVEGERARCLEAGMDDYLTKPLTLEKLRTTIAQWVALEGQEENGSPEPRLPRPNVAPDRHRLQLDESALDALRFNGGDGVPVLTKMIDAFLRTTPERIRKLAEAIANGDGDEVRLIAHTLKSSCAWLGARDLSRLFADLEASAQSGSSVGWSALLADIERQMTLVMAALRARRGEAASVSASPLG
jgi:signal transduction histidine kinase/DNA-binding response OmpR family regulator